MLKLFGQLLEKIGLLFTPTSGHTADKENNLSLMSFSTLRASDMKFATLNSKTFNLTGRPIDRQTIWDNKIFPLNLEEIGSTFSCHNRVKHFGIT